MNHPLVLAISGGSGAIYATRLAEVLLSIGQDLHLTISPPGVLVLKQELGLKIDLDKFSLEQLLPTGSSCFDHCPATAGDTTVIPQLGKVTYHHYGNFMASIASGSCLTSGMVICPCSGSTMSAVVTGASNNLIHRAADVHLKERRRIVLVPRDSTFPSRLGQYETSRRFGRHHPAGDARMVSRRRVCEGPG
jgi:4-hydroxy-3-polyprenylbenzoate decarboxylase